MEQVNKVFYELKFSGKLPSPAGVGMKILQLTQQEDCGLDEITKVVRSDPSLTGRILKVANAGMPKSGTAASTPLEEAVLKLGLASIRDLVLGFSLISANQKGSCPAFDYGAFWHASLGRAVVAQHLTELSGREAASESYVCGLLGGIGQLGLASAHPEPYSKLLEQNPDASDRAALSALETREFGICHAELTEALLRDWGFPERLARTASTFWHPVDDHRGESERLQILRQTLNLADRLVAHLNSAPQPAEPLPDAIRGEVLSLGIDEDQIEPALATIRTAWTEWGNLLNVSAPKPAARVESAPADSPDLDREASASGPASASSSSAQSSSAPAPAPAPAPVPTIDLLLLERDDALARSIEGALKAHGKSLVRARTVREALALAMTQAPRVVIAHGSQTDAEALELCTALRRFEAGRLTYFILATARKDPESLAAAFDTGVDDYLVLPIQPTEMFLRLRAAQRVLDLRSRLAEQEFALQQNLAELAVANRKLHRTAMTDELTQLPNRRFAEETMREGWATAHSKDADLSLIFGDIDHFKKINDSHGHLVGDMVLATVARVFRQELRASDVACRLGGEEFLIICPNTDLPAAQRCAERLRARVAATPIAVSGHKHQVTISMGVASRRTGCKSASTVEHLLKAADDAVYESKRTGRNRVSVGRPVAT